MEWPAIDWATMFTLSANPLEIFLRGSMMFWFLFAIFRFILRRGIGAVGIGDFLFVAIVADASQNAMSSDHLSVTDGLILVATLAFWNYLLDYLSFRFSTLRQFIEPGSLVLVKDGKLQRRNLQRQFITTEEIYAKLREGGIPALSQVVEMRLETNGEISVVCDESKQDEAKK
jgi:uncharacterized membrane protein YcaP (DUF421 family)